MVEKREKAKQHFEIEEDSNGKILSVSVEEYPFMATDGYNSKVYRKMEIQKEKLLTEIDKLRDEIDNLPKEIKQTKKTSEEMLKELKPIMDTKEWKEVKSNWKVYSKIFGTIKKEEPYNKILNEIERLEVTLIQDNKTLKHYEELAERMDK